MLVACCLVNLTSWRVAEDVWLRLRETHDVKSLAAAAPESLEEVLRPLGLWRRRSLGLTKLADQWLQCPPERAKDVLSMPGCGKYAHDSWAIFIDGRTDVDPRDGKLNWYLEDMRRGDTRRLAEGRDPVRAGGARAAAA
jgi:endonuclease III-like uncharacterized protein